MTATSLWRDGMLWFRNALSTDDIAYLSEHFAKPAPGKRLPGPAELLAATTLKKVLATVLPNYSAVRAVAFDKTPKSNWSLPWHQDRVVAVADRIEVEGYKNWSRKNDVWHCEPPVEVLRPMIFLRLHLDPSTADNGAMEIAPGSHRSGLVPSDRAEATANACCPEIAEASAGDVLALPMLTLHRSCPSMSGASRRVIRLDMACQSLASPLSWAN